MDKEDALIVFEEHIRELEKEHDEEIESEKEANSSNATKKS